jgi:hypothetical protein
VDGDEGLIRHLTKTDTIEQGVSNTVRGQNGDAYA